MDLVQIKATRNDPKAAFFESLEGFDRDYDLENGVPLLAEVPSGASFRMSADFPRQIALYDFLPNVNDVLVASEQVRTLFESERVKHVEYLPVQIVNHKGRKVKEKYFILNPFPLVDCADGKKTKFVRNALNKEKWEEVKNLTIEEKRVPADYQLFGVEHITGLRLIRRALAEKMKAAGVRGFDTVELSAYRW